MSGVRTVIYQFTIGNFPWGVRIDSSGNYIVSERYPSVLSKITPSGVRTVIYQFPTGTDPVGLIIDSSGNYIMTEWYPDVLSKITPSGVRTVIYSDFPRHERSQEFYGSEPALLDIDSSGNYIVAEMNGNVLSKITPSGVRTVIYDFGAGAYPVDVSIDSSGNYIVAEYGHDVISKVTPSGVRTVIYSFSKGSYPGIVHLSTVTTVFTGDVTESGLKLTWTRSADPNFASYQIYQSTTQGQLGTLIGTITNVATTSQTVTGLSPATKYYYTVRVVGAGGLYVDSAQRSETTATPFYMQTWFLAAIGAVAVVVVVIVVLLMRRK
jgi:tartrate dehydratase beta subunit/fumarate hydratase class I family protein